ncbi:MAG TPA: hypothetical protein VGK20_18735 [Candidatus Binatia bacterium]|jgi:hypothetical protein
MKARKWAGTFRLAAAAILVITAGTATSWAAAANTKQETGCQSAMTKGIGKHTQAVAKAMAACENTALAASMTPSCPDATATQAISDSATKIAKTIAKKCQSQCSISGVSCINDASCPPFGHANESCSGTTGKKPFNSGAMGFPGPQCEFFNGAPLEDGNGFAKCAAGYGEEVADEIITNIFGSLATTPSASAQSCLDAIVGAMPKAASSMAGAVSKCRVAQLSSESPVVLPNACATDDQKTSDSVAKAQAKLTSAIDSSCTNADVSSLDLCKAGIAGTTTTDAAKTCLSDALEQAAISVENAEDRPLAGSSIINGAYPKTSPARCGDNVVNQLPNQFAPNGEECDGTDDSACPGLCLPPGDTFECTCSNHKRARVFADGFAADLDNGWSGKSHNSKVTDRAGFVSDVTNCDCSLFDTAHGKAASCVAGHSTNPVCTVNATVEPRCSQNVDSGLSCDQFGNNDGVNESADCYACGDGADNAGASCTGTQRTCRGGTHDGIRCNSDTNCQPGGTCTGIGACVDGPFAGNGCAGPESCGVCLGGTNMGHVCSVPADCPLSSCQNHNCGADRCLGGSNANNSCKNAADCPGGACEAASDCASRCYDASNTPGASCFSQSDCPEGSRCKGACDKQTNSCIILRNGAPLPLSSAGTSVCVDSQFFTNVTGTRNIITGEHAVSYELRSGIILPLSGEPQATPCPVCGGYCATVGQTTDLFPCSGTCNGPELQCRYGPSQGATCTTPGTADATCGAGFLCGQVKCRFDSDCPTGTCDGSTSPDCENAACRLDLSCSYGTNAQNSCRIEANTVFGTTSSDCPPDGNNVSGGGLAIRWNPLTSAPQVLPGLAPCDLSGFSNLTCNCVTGGGGTRNKPNGCNAACNAGANFGEICKDFARCTGGTKAVCDSNADCPVGTCTGNPRVCGAGNVGNCSVFHCTGGSNDGTICGGVGNNGLCTGGGHCVATACTVGGAACTDGYCVPHDCTTNTDCEPSVTCDDACPGGLCSFLCVPHGKCNGGNKNGDNCALNVDCTGGGTCTPDDLEEGACAQGVLNHCNGKGWEFQSCGPTQVGTPEGCEAGTDSIVGNSNDYVGAGDCIADTLSCFINNGAAEGGSTLNGKGDATDSLSVATFCIPATSSNTVNPTAGLPGPGRIRQPSMVVPNFTSLP